MAIALVGTPTTAVGASGSITATTLTITVPTGSTGDLLLIGVSSASQATTGSTAPLITASSANTIKIGFIPSTLVSVALFYRVVQAGDPTTYTFTVSNGSPYGAVCARYSGVDPTTPFRHWNVFGNLDGGSVNGTSGAFPTSDNVQSTDLAVVFAAMGTFSKTTTQVAALSTPAGWTNVVAGFGPTSATSSFRTARAIYSKTAATDTPTVTGGTGHYAFVRVVLVDASNPMYDSPGGSIGFVDATTVASVATGAASVTVNTPGVVDGNLMLLFAGNSAGFGSWTVPAGWTSLGVGSGRYSMGTTSFVGDIVAQGWYKFASSEPSSYTVSFTGAGGSPQEYAVAIVAYSGVRNPYPIELTGITNTTATATTTTTAPYVLPQVSSDNLVVNCYVAGGDTTGTMTMTGPTSPWNQRAQIVSAVSADFNTAITIDDKLAASDQPTSTTSRATTSTVFSVTLVGAPATFLPWKPRLGPNYRR